MKYKTLSIIIPVYNEEKYIGRAVNEVLKANSASLKKEVIVVNDGSTDNTSKVLAQLAKRKQCIVLRHKQNQGKTAALRTGFLASKGDLVLVQDADLEYSPEDYPILLEPFLKYDADVVYGSRFISPRPHRIVYFWHDIGNKFLTLLSNMFTNLNLTDMETGYKVFKGDLIRKLGKTLQSRNFGFEPEITAKISKVKNVKIYEVGISYWGRTYAEGKKIRWTDGVKAVLQILRFNLLSW